MSFICQLCDQIFEGLPDDKFLIRQGSGQGPTLYIIDKRAHELISTDRKREKPSSPPAEAETSPYTEVPRQIPPMKASQLTDVNRSKIKPEPAGELDEL